MHTFTNLAGRAIAVLVLVEGMKNPAALVRGLVDKGLDVQIVQGARALKNLPPDYHVDVVVFCEKLLGSKTMFDVVAKKASIASAALVALSPTGLLRGKLVARQQLMNSG